MTIPPHKKALSWNVLEKCLVRFHKMPQSRAKQESDDLRARIESPLANNLIKAGLNPKGYNPDIFYHAEPFDVACDIVGNRLDVRGYSSEYERILNRYGW